MSAENDFTEAEQALAQGIEEILGKLPLVPDNIVESIDNYDLAEDDKTLVIWCTTTDGKHLYSSLSPGSPMRVSVSP